MEPDNRRHLRVAQGRSVRACFRIFNSLQLLIVLLVAVNIGVMAQAPTETYADREQGLKLYQQGDMAGAIKALRLATKKFKADPVAWHFLGLALSDSGDVKAARKAFEKAIQLRPSFAASHTALAYTLLNANKTKEAQREVQSALLLDPKDGRAHYILGTLILRRGDCHSASSHAEAAKLNEPSLAPAYLLRSQALLCDREMMGVRPLTIQGAAAATAVPPAELSREERLANAKKSALRFQEAAENLEKYLQLQPNAVEASLWREQLQTLRIYAEPAEKPESERTVFASSELTTKARVLAKPEPAYTEPARRAQITGTVVLRAVFAADGSIKHVLIMNGLPYGLTQQAIAAARQIKFIPATRNGQPASTYVQLEYNFNLY